MYKVNGIVANKECYSVEEKPKGLLIADTKDTIVGFIEGATLGEFINVGGNGFNMKKLSSAVKKAVGHG